LTLGFSGCGTSLAHVRLQAAVRRRCRRQVM